jgi:hypothetical protein
LIASIHQLLTQLILVHREFFRNSAIVLRDVHRGLLLTAGLGHLLPARHRRAKPPSIGCMRKAYGSLALPRHRRLDGLTESPSTTSCREV